MNKSIYFSIGIMSGTSLDGMDFVYVKFDTQKKPITFDILASKTYSYSETWKKTLQNAITFSEVDLQELNVTYGKLIGRKALEFMTEFSINSVDFIASHGHTILHQPANGITLQIGCGQEIANITKQQVICDFRTQDVLFGGQGAPLVPIGDALLFSEYDSCLNLGGFANISFQKGQNSIAFDICPVNIVMNTYAEKLGFAYDDQGNIARRGKINQALLNQLNSLAFYTLKHPKSLGLEWVQQEISPILERSQLQETAILRTFIEHIAIQISKEISNNSVVLITGGGAFNTFLIERIQSYSSSKLIIPSQEIINFKEALIFAFLGLLRLENKVNCLCSVTGAKQNHSSGVIFNAILKPHSRLQLKV